MDIGDRRIEQQVSDAVTQKPASFRTSRRDGLGRFLPFIARRGRTYTLHPPTLGKMQVLAGCYLALELDEEALMQSPMTETMRICEAKAEAVARLLAVATMDGKRDLTSEKAIAKRARRMMWECGPDDFRYAVALLLKQTDCANFSTAILLTKSLRQNAPHASKEEGVA